MSTWLDRWERRYTDRVRLLVEILPVLAQEPRFALKGGVPDLQPQARPGDAGATRACGFRRDLRGALQGDDGRAHQCASPAGKPGAFAGARVGGLDEPSCAFLRSDIGRSSTKIGLSARCCRALLPSATAERYLRRPNRPNLSSAKGTRSRSAGCPRTSWVIVRALAADRVHPIAPCPQFA